MSSIIYKILRPAEWQVAQSAEYFAGAPVDHADGYIHFSSPTQVAETAVRYFADTEIAHILAIDTALLPSDKLKWEKSRGGDLFPHLYAPLPMASVKKHWELKRTDGAFDFSGILKEMAS